MKQVCLVKGRVSVVDVPAPMCEPGGVLVRTSHSLISTGTELATTGGGEGLVRRALSNPQLLQKVWDKAAAVGIRQTFDLVRARVDSSFPLGYSSSGEVIEVGERVDHLKVGDRVACAGAGAANHAELNFVPQNLVAHVPAGVPYADAAFAALGAIALQGTRRLDGALGEQVVVVGLGLIGLLAVQLLRLSGVRVFGVDLLRARIDLGRSLGMEDGIQPNERDPMQAIAEWTGGAGADGVVVCATGGGDFSLLNRSFDFCRRKGRLVLIGDVPIRIARDRIYKKEIDFLISCSYGPGRYDPRYERDGVDYPLPYVRWTENRNMGEVLRLLENGSLQVSGMIGRIFAIEDAADAYVFLQSENRPIAALLDNGLPDRAARAFSRTVQILTPARATKGRVVLGVIGAGEFFRGVRLPHLIKHGGFFIKWASARSGVRLHDLGSRYRIPFVTTDAREILGDPEVTAVLIATRHDLHARFVVGAARAGKHVFVEKPLGLTTMECEEALAAAEASGVLVAVGFNRRFSPLAKKAKALLDRVREPKTILYRVNAGRLPHGHWLQDSVEGGGRLLGEGVHFFDFLRYLTGADPVEVKASALSHRLTGVDPTNVAVNVSFADGSLGILVYASQGHRGLPKERIEIFGGDQAIVIDDFAALHVLGIPGGRDDHRRIAEKGHVEILQNFHDALSATAALEVTGRDGYWATWCAEQAERSLRHGA